MWWHKFTKYYLSVIGTDKEAILNSCILKEYKIVAT